MSNRISIRDLEALVDRINEVTNSPMEYSVKDAEGKYIGSAIGHYHISQAYGGVCLHRVMNEVGGVTCPLGMGHVPKRELYNSMQSYLSGLTA